MYDTKGSIHAEQDDVIRSVDKNIVFIFYFNKCRKKAFINENKIIVLMCHLSHSCSEVKMVLPSSSFQSIYKKGKQTVTK